MENLVKDVIDTSQFHHLLSHLAGATIFSRSTIGNTGRARYSNLIHRLHQALLGERIATSLISMTKLNDISHNIVSYTELLQDLGGRYGLETQLNRRAYQRLTRGRYMHTKIWATLTEEERYLAQVLALAETNPGVIFSHQTAALLHGLPENVPQKVHLYAPQRMRSQGLAIHHGVLHLPTDTTVFLPGLRVTSLERTLEDLAGASEKAAGQWARL